MTAVVVLVGFFLLLRFNSKLERKISAHRILHAITLPLSHYLGLLDHELQNETHNPDPLISQAVLDHVTELRAFLLQPNSRDLVLAGKLNWVMPLNGILLSLEDSLESAIQSGWDDYTQEVKESVVLLSAYIKQTPTLRQLTERPVGIVSMKDVIIANDHSALQRSQ